MTWSTCQHRCCVCVTWQQELTAFISRSISTTNTHNCSTALFPGPPGWVPEDIFFWTLWFNGRIMEADTPTIRCHSIRTNQRPTSIITPISCRMPFLPTLPLYPGLGQAPNMLACIPHSVVFNSQYKAVYKRKLTCEAESFFMTALKNASSFSRSLKNSAASCKMHYTRRVRLSTQLLHQRSQSGIPQQHQLSEFITEDGWTQKNMH